MRNLVTPPEQAARYREAGLWTPDTLSSRVAGAARERGSSIAVIDQLGERSRTYAQLAGDAAALAQALTANGIAAGDVVSVQLPNWYEAAVVAVAVNAIGGVINPLLPNYRAHELSHVLRTAHPKAVVTPAIYRGFDHRELVRDAAAATGEHPMHLVVDDHEGTHAIDGAGSDPLALPQGVESAAVSELIFTSGTEATPKAIMHTEETANFAARSLFEALRLGEEAPSPTVVWMPSPVGHSTGFNFGLRMALIHGARLVLQDKWNAPEARELVRRYGCQYTLAATTFLEDLVSECERTGETLASLTHFGCGGAPVPAPLVRRAEAVGIQVLRLYGSTEVLCATWNRPESPADKRGNTDGYALPYNDIQVRDDAGQVLEPPAEGELHVRGPNTSVGFFADPERTAATYLPDGFVKSGDLASVDADGYLTIVGRKKEIIIRGGVNIAPREIEDLIAAFPEVRAVAVVPVPDPRLGERGCACVVLHPGAALDFDTLVARLRETGLATYKLPESMVVLDELPRTASGKIQKHEILRRLEPLVTYDTQPIPDASGLAATITLNRPAELNAMSWDLIRAFDEAVSRSQADPEVRVVFVTGKGRAFSAGGDLKSYVTLQRDPVRFPQFVQDIHDAFGRLRTLRTPVIALVNGVTAAGGLELLLGCDLVLAAESARIADGHLNFGQMGGGGVLTLLARMIGLQRATELVLTGRFLSAQEAAEWGLVAKVVPDGELVSAGLELARQIAVKSPLAVANAKSVMTTIWTEAMSVPSGLALELSRNATYCLTSEDAPEGLQAFSEKRAPKFTGR